jgi:hypothetical protein
LAGFVLAGIQSGYEAPAWDTARPRPAPPTKAVIPAAQPARFRKSRRVTPRRLPLRDLLAPIGTLLTDPDIVE